MNTRTRTARTGTVVRLLTAGFAVILAFGVSSAALPAGAGSAPAGFRVAAPVGDTISRAGNPDKGCSRFHRKYPRGIAKNKRKAKVYESHGNLRPQVKQKIYRKNKNKDRNKDRVICGVRRPHGNHSNPTPNIPPPDIAGKAVIAAAGDIACPPGTPAQGSGSGSGATCRQWWVSEKILSNWDRITTVTPLGDNQYNNGSYSDYLGSYDPSWGRLNEKVAPVMGNHEADGQGYFDYFNGVGVTTGVAGVRRDGWYSYNTGNTPTKGWHVVALNSECVGKECGTRQLAWLQTDLESNTKGCTLAYWHKPRFSSGSHGDDSSMQPFWNLLNQHHAEAVLSGHDHNYERQVPRDAAGLDDPANGVRQFVVGTGGKEFRSISAGTHSETVNGDTMGYLELTLNDNSYDWNFVRADFPGNGTYTDTGSTTCH